MVSRSRSFHIPGHARGTESASVGQYAQSQAVVPSYIGDSSVDTTFLPNDALNGQDVNGQHDDPIPHDEMSLLNAAVFDDADPVTSPDIAGDTLLTDLDMMRLNAQSPVGKKNSTLWKNLTPGKSNDPTPQDGLQRKGSDLSPRNTTPRNGNGGNAMKDGNEYAESATVATGTHDGTNAATAGAQQERFPRKTKSADYKAKKTHKIPGRKQLGFNLAPKPVKRLLAPLPASVLNPPSIGFLPSGPPSLQQQAEMIQQYGQQYAQEFARQQLKQHQQHQQRPVSNPPTLPVQNMIWQANGRLPLGSFSIANNKGESVAPKKRLKQELDFFNAKLRVSTSFSPVLKPPSPIEICSESPARIGANGAEQQQPGASQQQQPEALEQPRPGALQQQQPGALQRQPGGLQQKQAVGMQGPHFAIGVSQQAEGKLPPGLMTAGLVAPQQQAVGLTPPVLISPDRFQPVSDSPFRSLKKTGAIFQAYNQSIIEKNQKTRATRGLSSEREIKAGNKDRLSEGKDRLSVGKDGKRSKDESGKKEKTNVITLDNVKQIRETATELKKELFGAKMTVALEKLVYKHNIKGRGSLTSNEVGALCLDEILRRMQLSLQNLRGNQFRGESIQNLMSMLRKCVFSLFTNNLKGEEQLLAFTIADFLNVNGSARSVVGARGSVRGSTDLSADPAVDGENKEGEDITRTLSLLVNNIVDKKTMTYLVQELSKINAQNDSPEGLALHGIASVVVQRVRSEIPFKRTENQAGGQGREFIAKKLDHVVALARMLQQSVQAAPAVVVPVEELPGLIVKPKKKKGGLSSKKKKYYFQGAPDTDTGIAAQGLDQQSPDTVITDLRPAILGSPHSPRMSRLSADGHSQWEHNVSVGPFMQTSKDRSSRVVPKDKSKDRDSEDRDATDRSFGDNKERSGRKKSARDSSGSSGSSRISRNGGGKRIRKKKSPPSVSEHPPWRPAKSFHPPKKPPPAADEPGDRLSRMSVTKSPLPSFEPPVANPASSVVKAVQRTSVLNQSPVGGTPMIIKAVNTEGDRPLPASPLSQSRLSVSTLSSPVELDTVRPLGQPSVPGLISPLTRFPPVALDAVLEPPLLKAQVRENSLSTRLPEPVRVPVQPMIGLYPQSPVNFRKNPATDGPSLSVNNLKNQSPFRSLTPPRIRPAHLATNYSNSPLRLGKPSQSFLESRPQSRSAERTVAKAGPQSVPVPGFRPAGRTNPKSPMVQSGTATGRKSSRSPSPKEEVSPFTMKKRQAKSMMSPNTAKTLDTAMFRSPTAGLVSRPSALTSRMTATPQSAIPADGFRRSTTSPQIDSSKASPKFPGSRQSQVVPPKTQPGRQSQVPARQSQGPGRQSVMTPKKASPMLARSSSAQGLENARRSISPPVANRSATSPQLGGHQSSSPQQQAATRRSRSQQQQQQADQPRPRLLDTQIPDKVLACQTKLAFQVVPSTDTTKPGPAAEHLRKTFEGKKRALSPPILTTLFPQGKAPKMGEPSAISPITVKVASLGKPALTNMGNSASAPDLHRNKPLMPMPRVVDGKVAVVVPQGDGQVRDARSESPASAGLFRPLEHASLSPLPRTVEFSAPFKGAPGKLKDIRERQYPLLSPKAKQPSDYAIGMSVIFQDCPGDYCPNGWVGRSGEIVGERNGAGQWLVECPVADGCTEKTYLYEAVLRRKSESKDSRVAKGAKAGDVSPGGGPPGGSRLSGSRVSQLTGSRASRQSSSVLVPENFPRNARLPSSANSDATSRSSKSEAASRLSQPFGITFRVPLGADGSPSRSSRTSFSPVGRQSRSPEPSGSILKTSTNATNSSGNLLKAVARRTRSSTSSSSSGGRTSSGSSRKQKKGRVQINPDANTYSDAPLVDAPIKRSITAGAKPKKAKASAKKKSPASGKGVKFVSSRPSARSANLPRSRSGSLSGKKKIAKRGRNSTAKAPGTQLQRARNAGALDGKPKARSPGTQKRTKRSNLVPPMSGSSRSPSPVRHQKSHQKRELFISRDLDAEKAHERFVKAQKNKTKEESLKKKKESTSAQPNQSIILYATHGDGSPLMTVPVAPRLLTKCRSPRKRSNSRSVDSPSRHRRATRAQSAIVNHLMRRTLRPESSFKEEPFSGGKSYHKPNTPKGNTARPTGTPKANTGSGSTATPKSTGNSRSTAGLQAKSTGNRRTNATRPKSTTPNLNFNLSALLVRQGELLRNLEHTLSTKKPAEINTDAVQNSINLVRASTDKLLHWGSRDELTQQVLNQTRDLLNRYGRISPVDPMMNSGSEGINDVILFKSVNSEATVMNTANQNSGALNQKDEFSHVDGVNVNRNGSNQKPHAGQNHHDDAQHIVSDIDHVMGYDAKDIDSDMPHEAFISPDRIVPLQEFHVRYQPGTHKFVEEPELRCGEDGHVVEHVHDALDDIVREFNEEFAGENAAQGSPKFRVVGLHDYDRDKDDDLLLSRSEDAQPIMGGTGENQAITVLDIGLESPRGAADGGANAAGKNALFYHDPSSKGSLTPSTLTRYSKGSTRNSKPSMLTPAAVRNFADPQRKDSRAKKNVSPKARKTVGKAGDVLTQAREGLFEAPSQRSKCSSGRKEHDAGGKHVLSRKPKTEEISGAHTGRYTENTTVQPSTNPGDLTVRTVATVLVHDDEESCTVDLHADASVVSSEKSNRIGESNNPIEESFVIQCSPLQFVSNELGSKKSEDNNDGSSKVSNNHDAPSSVSNAESSSKNSTTTSNNFSSEASSTESSSNTSSSTENTSTTRTTPRSSSSMLTTKSKSVDVQTPRKGQADVRTESPEKPTPGKRTIRKAPTPRVSRGKDGLNQVPVENPSVGGNENPFSAVPNNPETSSRRPLLRTTSARFGFLTPSAPKPTIFMPRDRTGGGKVAAKPNIPGLMKEKIEPLINMRGNSATNQSASPFRKNGSVPPKVKPKSILTPDIPSIRMRKPPDFSGITKNLDGLYNRILGRQRSFSQSSLFGQSSGSNVAADIKGSQTSAHVKMEPKISDTHSGSRHDRHQPDYIAPETWQERYFDSHHEQPLQTEEAPNPLGGANAPGDDSGANAESDNSNNAANVAIVSLFEWQGGDESRESLKEMIPDAKVSEVVIKKDPEEFQLAISEEELANSRSLGGVPGYFRSGTNTMEMLGDNPIYKLNELNRKNDSSKTPPKGLIPAKLLPGYITSPGLGSGQKNNAFDAVRYAEQIQQNKPMNDATNVFMHEGDLVVSQDMVEAEHPDANDNHTAAGAQRNSLLGRLAQKADETKKAIMNPLRKSQKEENRKERKSA